MKKMKTTKPTQSCKKRLFASLVCLAMLLCGMLSTFSLQVFAAQGTHGFYMNCPADVTNYKSDGFMIDVYTDSDNAVATYWANANWGMNVSASERKLGLDKITHSGAYAGIQHRTANPRMAGIMSMWRWEYKDEDGNDQTLYGDAMIGTGAHYGNEGSGTSCILPYSWEYGKWFRQLLYCWDDEETGNTFIGTWFYNYETGVWSLLTYYNTHLVDSYIDTNVDQFLENFVPSYNNRLRSFRYKNVYFLGHGETEWVSQPNVRVFTDENLEAVGECSLGISEDGTYVWGQVDGTDGKNVTNSNFTKLEQSFTLNQPASPTYGTPSFAAFDLSDLSNVTWEMEETGTPQLSYRLTVTDAAGRIVSKTSGTRPEVRSASLPAVTTEAYKLTLTVRDVFGQEVSAERMSDAYAALQDVEQPEAVNYNDVNNDGDVNITDASALLNALSGSGANVDADLTGDGVSEISDVTFLLNALSGVPGAGYSKGLVYTLSDDGASYTVTSAGSCADENVRIPAAYAGIPVRRIESFAFYGRNYIKTLELPQTLTQIGDYAFVGCGALLSAVLPAQMEALGEAAFADCALLDGVSIPEGLTSVGEAVFANCAALKTIDLPGSVLRVEKDAFAGTSLQTVRYGGATRAEIRVLPGNEPFLSASTVTVEEQEAKNGLVQEDGGIRFYQNGQMRTGWQTIDGSEVFFDRSTGKMVSAPSVIDGSRCRFESFSYDDLTMFRLHDREPDKENDLQAWISWLKSVDGRQDLPTYRPLQSGSAFLTTHAGASDASAWEVWNGHYQFDYCIQKSDLDLTRDLGKTNYPYVWEILYRKARTGDDFKSITTKPWSVYNVENAIYRLDTYDEGMDDLETAADGSPQEYEFVFLFYENGTDKENIIAWRRDFIDFTDSAKMHRDDALADHLIGGGAVDDSYIVPKNATCSNVVMWGNNEPANVLDGIQDTVCGSAFSNGNQSVQINFEHPEMVREVFIQCKDEGTTTNSDGSRGTYSLYAIYGEEETLIASSVPAITGTDGGYTVTLDTPLPAEAVKAVITSWQGNCWACVADLLAKGTGEIPPTPDVPRWLTDMTASRKGFGDFGDANKPSNVLDNNQSTVCGSGYNANVEQSVTVTFAKPEKVCEVFVQCKNEGTTPNSDGSRGTYSIYAIYGGAQTLIASNVPAMSGTDGGYSVVPEAPVDAEAVKVVITSWQGSAWACVADIAVKATGAEVEAPRYDAAGNILNMTASSSGFASYSNNGAANVLDDDQSTVCGSGFNANTEQSVTVSFPHTENVASVYIRCKNEGTTSHPDGKTRGTYDLYAIKDGVQTLIASDVPARIQSDGGCTVTLDAPVSADAVKAVITSWQGNCWACIADISVKAAVS